MTYDIEFKENVPYDLNRSENLLPCSTKFRRDYINDNSTSLCTIQMDKFQLPKLVNDVIFNMKKNGVCEVEIQDMN